MALRRRRVRLIRRDKSQQPRPHIVEDTPQYRHVLRHIVISNDFKRERFIGAPPQQYALCAQRFSYDF